ncbi:MAG: DALR anticodon-binding domain-containing protein, partial [Acutalibacteraceae bacterium]|nr:DALR anticodon-binding domain-containing protein [Acutalibacteraceae bacterium]
EQSSQNPVYYVQYAYARICSILRNLESEGITPRECTEKELSLLTLPEERELINLLAAFTKTVENAAAAYDPAKLTHYVVTVASQFHKFYNSCRIKGVEEELLQARLTLCIAARTVIKNVLTALKISTPESM